MSRYSCHRLAHPEVVVGGVEGAGGMMPSGGRNVPLSANAATVDKKWVLIDAEGLVVGRAASIIAGGTPSISIRWPSRM